MAHLAYDLEGQGGGAGQSKSGGGLVRPDKHFWEIPEGVLCLWGFFRNDLEGLPAGAGQIEKRRGFAQRRQA